MKSQVDLIGKMIEYYAGDSKRIQHFIKVYNFAKTIGELENIDNKTLFILEAASITHDIGIKISEEKYGNCSGKNQEKEGPTIAKVMLEGLEYDDEVIDRVCYLIAHHHTYEDIQGIDYQILVEADFLVNLYEDNVSKKGIITAYQRIFKTRVGKRFCRQMFNIVEDELLN